MKLGKMENLGVPKLSYSERTKIKNEKKSQLMNDNIEILRDLKSISRQGKNIVFENSSNRKVYIPEDVFVNVFNKTLMKGLSEKKLTKLEVAIIFKKVLELDNSFSVNVQKKNNFKVKANGLKFLLKLIPSLPIGLLPMKLDLAGKNLKKSLDYLMLKDVYTMTLLASDPDTFVDFVSSCRGTEIKLESVNLGLSYLIGPSDSDTFEKISQLFPYNNFNIVMSSLNTLHLLEFNKTYDLISYQQMDL